MANEEHVKRLKGSIPEWNKWREDHREIRPNLSDAGLYNTDLRGADLSGSDLSGADLSLTNLRGVSLKGANLIRVDVSGADLSGADLSGADLIDADMINTELINANLSGTRLGGTNLSGTRLGGANFYEVFFQWTIFDSLDLSKVKRLETARHEGPSIVNINSVILPYDEETCAHFLRGVGFTETQIEYLPSLLTPRPIQYHSLFISHAHQDEALAQRLYTYLRKQNVPCWFAPHDMRPGNYVRERIDQAIHTQDKLLLLLSEHSVTSGWVRYEVEQALARENTQQREILFPLRLDDTIFHSSAGWAASLRATRHIGDFTGWQDEQRYQEACATLLRHLKAESSQKPK